MNQNNYFVNAKIAFIVILLASPSCVLAHSDTEGSTTPTVPSYMTGGTTTPTMTGGTTTRDMNNDITLFPPSNIPEYHSIHENETLEDLGSQDADVKNAKNRATISYYNAQTTFYNRTNYFLNGISNNAFAFILSVGCFSAFLAIFKVLESLPLLIGLLFKKFSAFFHAVKP